MDLLWLQRGQQFIWDAEKAGSNLKKHGVSFETACEVFFDPLLRIEDAGEEPEESAKPQLGWPLIGDCCCCSCTARS